MRFVIAFFGIFFFTLLADARPRGIVAITTCNFTATAASDGCLNAPSFINSTLNLYVPNLMTVDGPQSGQSYTLGIPNINWNQSGVAPGYAVGIKLTGSFTGGAFCNGTTIPCSTNPGLTQFIDPTTYNWTTDPANTGCGTGSSYTGGSSGIVTCHPKALVNLIGFDWTSSTCTAINVASPVAGVTGGTINFTNNYVKLGNVSACTTPVQTYPYRFNPSNTQVWDVNISNNMLDSQAFQSWNQISNQPSLFLISTGGSFTAKYNGISNAIARVFSATICTAHDVEFNVLHNIGYYPGTLHGEIALHYAQAGCQPNQTYLNNTMWQDATLAAPAVTAPISSDEANGSTAPFTAPFGIFKWNTVIANLLPNYVLNDVQNNNGVAGSQSGTYTVGDILAVNATFGGGTPCAVLPQVRVNSVSAGAIVTTGSTGTTPYSGGNCASQPTNGAFYSTSCISCAASPSGATVSYNFNNKTAGGLVAMNDNTYGNLTIQSNALDTTGSFFSIQYSSTVCSGASTVSGNFSLTTGSVVSITGSSTGCSAGP